MFNGLSYIDLGESVADFGAKRTLGMGGSLMGYIQTGNAYDKRYYRKNPARDTYQSNHKPKKRFDKLITGAVVALGAFATAFALYKRGFIKLDKIKGVFSTIKNKLPKIKILDKLKKPAS